MTITNNIQSHLKALVAGNSTEGYLGVYSVFDSKASAFLQPYFTKSNATAIRAFQRCLLDPTSDISKFGADFTLVKVGTWDEIAGQMRPLDQHENLGTGLTLMPKEQN